MDMSADPLRLTPMMASRRLLLLQFIEVYFTEMGQGPSLDEMARALDVCKQRAHRLVLRLERDGLVQRTRGQSRSVRPLTAREKAIRLLRHEGYVVDEDILVARQPLHATVYEGVTNRELPWPPVLDHIPEDERDQEGHGAPDNSADTEEDDSSEGC